jgi:hypothetical protein
LLASNRAFAACYRLKVKTIDGKVISNKKLSLSTAASLAGGNTTGLSVGGN